MQIAPRQALLQCNHIFQQTLFPSLESEIEPLSAQLRLLARVIELVPLGPGLTVSRATAPPWSRPFSPRPSSSLPATRQLIDCLRADAQLRRLCGWNHILAIPHESKFSRAFALFAENELPQQLNAPVIAATQSGRLIGHIARDSTAIEARKRVPESVMQQKRRSKAVKPRRKLGAFARAKAAEHDTRIERQRQQKPDAMLARLPRHCDIGLKAKSRGHENYWRAYKFHLDDADGHIPISALPTSASVHDSQAAISLMTMTSQRVQYHYDLMDSAVHAGPVHEHSRQLNHQPIIAVHSRRGAKKPSKLPKVYPPKPVLELTWARQEHCKERTMSERVNARLKDEFGAGHIRVRGPVKGMAHLIFGMVALAVDQGLRLAGNQA